MPLFSAQQLCEVSERILAGLGMSAEDARRTAEVLVEANLAGHDSHGVIRLPQYAHYVRAGQIKPAAPFQVIKQAAAMAVVSGNGNLGHVTMLRALDIALEKAAHSAVATVMVRDCNHVGRLGAYPLRAAKQGYAAFMGVNSPGGRCVVPWGGIERRMGTNPLAIAAPTRGEPLVLDVTTSVVAEGKVRVLHHKKQPAPPDWLLNSEGQPTTRTEDFYGTPSGSLLPMGGSVGYKGFGLSVMLDVLSGSMSGQGAYRPDLTPGHNGVWLTLWKVDAFVPLEDYLADVDRLTTWIKSSRRQSGIEEILLPGEIEARTMARRAREGVQIPDETWQQIQEAASQLEVQL